MSLTSSPGRISGIELRYMLVLLLAEQGRPQSVAELVAALEARGHKCRGRAGKAVSDALRWEVARGRVLRLDRDRYAPGRLPRSSEWSMRRRLAAGNPRWPFGDG